TPRNNFPLIFASMGALNHPDFGRWTYRLPFAAFLVLCMPAFMRAGIPVAADAYVDSGYSSVNFGSAPYLQIGGSTQTFLQFSLASLPSGFSASKANLVLWVNRVVTGGSVNVKPL